MLAGLNRYAYCNNNPVIFTDPSGHNPHYTYGDGIVSDSYQENGSTYTDVTYIGIDGYKTYTFAGDTITYSPDGSVITGSQNSGNENTSSGSGQNGGSSGNDSNKQPDPIGKNDKGSAPEKDPFAEWNANVTQFNNDFYAACGYIRDHCANFDFGSDFFYYAMQSWNQGDYLNWALWDINFMLEATLDGLLCYVGVRYVASLIYEVPIFIQKIKDVAGNSSNAFKLQNRLIAEEITGGHAYWKHASEFGITNKLNFKLTIESMLNNPNTMIRELSGGRTAYWLDDLGAVLIRNPSAIDGGTFFKPTAGIDYFLNLR